MTASAPQKRFVPDTPPEQDLQHVKKHVKALVDRIQEQVPFEEVEATTDRVYLKITLSKRKVPLCFVQMYSGAVYIPEPGGKDAWRAGAKGGVRFDLMDDESRKLCFELAEPTGSFLCNNTDPRVMVG